MGEVLCTERLRHFGLKQDPFAEKADDGPWVDLAPQRRALNRIRLAVEAKRSLIVLSGESGVGKTRLMRELYTRWVEGSEFYPVYLSLRHPEADDENLARFVARKMGVVHPAPDARILLRQVFRRLQHHHQMGQRVLLLVDDADQLSAGVGNLLRDLSGLLSAEGALMTCILGLGRPDFEPPRIEQSEAEAAGSGPLGEMTPLVVALGPLDATARGLYLAQRLQWAGAEPSLVEAMLALPWEQIERPARGVTPKQVQVLADSLLSEAYVARLEGEPSELEDVWIHCLGQQIARGSAPSSGYAEGGGGRFPVPGFPDASNEDLGFGVEDIAASVAEESVDLDDDSSPQLSWIE